MCGIFGFVGKHEQAEQLDFEAAARMLRHRGPDGTASYKGRSRRPGDDRACVLIATRLAILDLTAAAEQPMTTHDGRYALVYNGEIYNFREIRSELEAEGFVFSSTGDTEVLLNAYKRYGASCVDRLRGMFAFAIWDGDEGRLFAARDRLGIKPLYYVETPEGLAFASELRVLMAQNVTSRHISPRGLVDYLRFGSVQEPYTLVDGVRLLPAAHVLNYERGDLALRRYWDFPPPGDRKLTFDQAVEKIQPVLREAIRLHLVSEVPLGVFLSGGIDSSVVTSIASQQVDQPLQTFTVTFDETSYSEKKYAAEVAEAFGCNHHQVHLSVSRVVAEIDRVVEALDQPSADGINTYFVSEAAHEAGLTVALSGLGGDEVFAGYDSFRQFGVLRHLVRIASRIPRPLLAGMEWMARLDTTKRVERAVAIALNGRNSASAYAAIRCNFTTRQIASLLTPEASAQTREASAVPFEAERFTNDSDSVNAFSRLELSHYLRNTLLRDADVMSMCHSLEVRVPLIDHILVEQCIAIPGRLKLSMCRKKPLIMSAAPPLPQSVASRSKMGFVLPVDNWFRGPLREKIHEMLGEAAGSDQVLSRPALERSWTRFLRGEPSMNATRLWSLVVLRDWCGRYGVGFGS